MKKIKEELSEQRISFPLNDFKILVSDSKVRANEKAFHEEIEIKYYYEGVSTLIVDKDIIVANPGDITVVNPFEIHANVDIGQANGKYLSIILNLDFLKELNPNGLDLRKAFVTSGKKLYNHIVNNQRMQSIILQVNEEIKGEKENYRLVVYALITELFALLLRDYVNNEKVLSKAEKYTKRADLISPALTKIFEDFNKKITIKELADLCSVSEYHFLRTFKKETGFTAIQYIINYRISLAETLLKTTENTIEEIAYACGFDDVSYFYRCYKKIKGISPKKSRKQ